MPGYILLEQDKELLPVKYMCSFCGYLLRDARQTPCGHFYCDDCVNSLAIAGTLTCLQDAEQCPLTQVYPDNFVRREVLALVVRCTNMEAGCKWRGEVRHFTTHTSECPFQSVNCDRPDCNVVVMRKDLQDHLKNDCKYRTKPCEYCGDKVQLADMQMLNHLHPVSGDCTERDRPCPFSSCGCPAKENMDPRRHANHMTNQVTTHHILLLEEILKLKYKDLQQEQLSPQQQLLPTGVTCFQDQQCDELKREVVALRELVMRNQAVNDHRHEQQNKINANHRDHIAIAGTDFQRIQQSHQSHETAQGGIIQAAEINTTISQMPPRDGAQEYIWKIDQVAQRRNDAISGQVITFCSPPFYSGPQGYKMCARVYLNGDGIGLGNSISLFFVIMPGEYDEQLRWPFRHKVTLMLLDQDNMESVIDTFRPDPSSPSFQKPRTVMNIARGCPKFCPLTELPRRAYIRDNTMIIKIIVETLDA